MITPKQDEYIKILAIDLGLTREQLYDYISIRCHRRVKYLDELLSSEASQIITQMLKDKENAKQRNSSSS